MSNRNIDQEDWKNYYNQWKRRNEIPANWRVIEAINSVIDVRGKRILEVGSATGRDSIYLAKLGAKLYILDYIFQPLQLALQIGNGTGVKITPVQGNAFKLPFDDNTFDFVYSQGLLEHFRNPLKLILEQTRVLKPLGLLLIDVPQKYHIYTILKHILMALGKWTPGWETEFTIEQLQTLLRGADLDFVYSYGDWSNPSILIKSIKYLTGNDISNSQRKDSNIRLINRFRKSILALYTFQHIGIVGRKRGK
jgi:ubiquinone/menaquinone biosynthesis C-methylase UbiE